LFFESSAGPYVLPQLGSLAISSAPISGMEGGVSFLAASGVGAVAQAESMMHKDKTAFLVFKR
jgi:hypothetical protein